MVKSFNRTQHTQNQKIQTAQQKDTHAYTYHFFLKLAPRGTSAAAHCSIQQGRAFAKELARTHTPNRTETKQKNQRQELLTPRNTHTHTHTQRTDLEKETWCVVALTSTSNLHRLLFLSLSNCESSQGYL
jgi:hypothetical protein